MMNKKGDIGLVTLVSIIVVIISAVIILLFLTGVISFGLAADEACHQSILLRATLPLGQGFVPLNCRTERVCVTAKTFGGKCEEFSGSETVTKTRVSNEDQLQKSIALDMLDCWTMSGEGKVDLFSSDFAKNYGLASEYPSCIICSRIAFDNESFEGNIDMSKIDVGKYMETHAVSGEEISYIEYIGGEGAVKVSLENNLGDLNQKTYTESELNSKIENDIKENRSPELAVMFIQMSAPGDSQSIKDLVATMVAPNFIGSDSFGFYNTGELISNNDFSSSYLIKDSEGNEILDPLSTSGLFVIQQASTRNGVNVGVGRCFNALVGKGSRAGCSVVRLVNFEDESIGHYCKHPESIRS